MNDTPGGQNESSFNRNNRLARDNSYERAHHRRVMTFMVFMAVVTLFGLYRTQESMQRSERATRRAEQLTEDNHRMTIELMQIREELNENCRTRSMAREILRRSILEDQDTSPELRAEVETGADFQPITC